MAVRWKVKIDLKVSSGMNTFHKSVKVIASEYLKCQMKAIFPFSTPYTHIKIMYIFHMAAASIFLYDTMSLLTYNSLVLFHKLAF